MKEALYYRKSKETVICELCPHVCRLKEGETGLCKTRINQNGKLYAINYGYPCALHIDPVEKKPLYHFLSGTSTLSISTKGCNLACLNCQNHNISQSSPSQSDEVYVNPEEVVSMALEKGCQSIAYTYTDPTVYYEYMLEIAQLARSEGLRNILVSAGYINPKPLRNLLPYIDAANIDLKCFNDKQYQELCGARLTPVLNTLLTINQSPVWLEICNLIVPGYSDDMTEIKDMLSWLVENNFQEVPIHFNRFVPAYKLHHLNATPIPQLIEIAELAKSEGLKYVYVGNIGISQYSHTYCSSCQSKMINRSDYSLNLIGEDYGKCELCGEEMKGVWS